MLIEDSTALNETSIVNCQTQLEENQVSQDDVLLRIGEMEARKKVSY